MFAEKYIAKSAPGKILGGLPQPELGMVIVIPAYKEDNVLKTLNSLLRCSRPSCLTEIIILINHPEDAATLIKAQSLQTYRTISAWSEKASGNGMAFYPTLPVSLPRKWAGAGLARKKGMDEAVRRFNYLNKPAGLIISLDADTLVERNYLAEIERYFASNPKSIGATIAFEHQVAGLPEKHRAGIALYEQYMKYYKEAMSFTGYPYALFTIGSAFAVTAEAYVKRGGMNRRKAGEDFYFLQNLVLQGEVGEITATKVHPSARLSDRVPFGTGPILKKWIEGKEDLAKTYNFQAFIDLKAFLALNDKMFKITKPGFENLLNDLPLAVTEFLIADKFFRQVDELSRNCSSPEVFCQRFFQVFNAFKILKFLNFAHGRFYDKADLKKQVLRLKSAG